MAVYAPRYRYNKAGTLLTGLVPVSARQSDLLSDVAGTQRSEQLTATMDRINARYGRSSVELAGSGLEKLWTANARNRSPPYTTDWDQLPIAK
jgi:DNA polymerase V